MDSNVLEVLFLEDSVLPIYLPFIVKAFPFFIKLNLINMFLGFKALKKFTLDLNNYFLGK